MTTLRFDFENEPVYFEQPLKVISTIHLAEVADCFTQIDEALAQGCYVAGYLAYEAAPAFDSKLVTKKQGKIPLLWFGVFAQKQTVPELNSSTRCNPAHYHWLSDTEESDYNKAIKHIHHTIEHGDTYQINYTLRLKSQFADNDALPFYQHLKQAQQSSFCAYLDLDDFQILSASPELFFKRDGRTITTRPMKGTMPRGMTPTQDCANKTALAASEKDKAENIMIVDLLRNDLSHLAKLGTVKVRSLFEIEQYPSVWQMTSSVEAELKNDNIACFELFKALFPCGSITGAPKMSAMNTIAHLEKSPRDVYCGAVGYFTPDKKAVFNVPIRTVLIDKQQQTATYGVGGGVTWYSTARAEYQEALDKAKIILSEVRIPKQLLESFLIKDGNIFLKEAHLARLKNSSAYFGFLFPEASLQQALDQLAGQYPTGQYKGRLLLERTGMFKLSCTALTPLTAPIKATWTPSPINTRNALFYHKTSERQIYPPATLEQEVLLFNDKDEITEFVNGNVVLLINGQWYTPPIASGLLGGTLRSHLLEQKKISEKVLYKDDVQNADEIVFINSVRGWVRVQITALTHTLTNIT